MFTRQKSVDQLQLNPSNDDVDYDIARWYFTCVLCFN